MHKLVISADTIRELRALELSDLITRASTDQLREMLDRLVHKPKLSGAEAEEIDAIRLELGTRISTKVFNTRLHEIPDYMLEDELKRRQRQKGKIG